jgi:threonine/homoserine/homoserine lactone efflux protein
LGSTIGEILPLAVAVALSPLPIVGVILMLGTPRGKANGITFLLGWFIGCAVVCAIGTSLSSATSGDSDPSTVTRVVLSVLGALLLLLAVKQWRSRPKPGVEPVLPKWMHTMDSITPPKALVMAFLLSAVNPKNLMLGLAAGSTIAAASLNGSQQMVAIAVFTLIAMIGVAIPFVIYVAAGAKAEHILADLKTWMVANNAAIMAVLFLIFGVKLLGSGLGG